MMVRKFKKFYKKDQSRRKFHKGNSSTETKKPIICYECEKPGHIKSECPQLKNKEKRFNKFKKKAYVSAIWGNSSSDEDEAEEEEDTNLCLVAQEESDSEQVSDSNLPYVELSSAYNSLFTEFKKTAKELLSSKRKIKSLEEQAQIISTSISACEKENFACPNHDTKPTYDELFAEYNLVQNEFDELAEKYLALKKKNTTLELQTENLSSSKNIICDECIILKKKNEYLTKTLEKFTRGSEMLEVILKQQRFTNDKSGIGYKPDCDKKKGKRKHGQKLYMNYFQKSVHTSNPFAHCNYCNKKGHTTSSCFHRKDKINKPVGNYQWVPKGSYAIPKTQTNSKGPKKKWVPKE